MKTHCSRLLAFLCLLLMVSAAFAAEDVSQAEKPIGLTGWRVGFSNGLFLTAPENLASGGVPWNTEQAIAFFPSCWSAENPSVRVEIVRAPASRFDDLRNKAFTHIGGSANAGRKFKLDSYDTVQLIQNGKTATIVKHAAYAWGIVITPGSAPDAQTVSQEVVRSLWFERAEKPDWKDRVVGYSWQAELPYEMSEEYTESKSTESYRVRWGDFSVTTLKGGAYTDFDKTVANQVEAMSKRADIKDVKVQRFAREFGYLAKERGVAVQIDFKRGEEPHRAYKIATVTGYGGIFTTINLKPKNPDHLAWAHRILATLRLGYGVPGDNYRKVDLKGEAVSYENEATFKAPQNDGVLNSFVSTDGRNFAFVMNQGDNVIIPLSGELNDLGLLARDTMIGNVVQGAGGKLTQATILPAAVGAFPARRIRFEALFNKKNTFYGDALVILTARKLYLPMFLTETATNDKMPRVAGSWEFDNSVPKGWKQQGVGGKYHVLLPEDAKATQSDGKTIYQAKRDGIEVYVEVKQENFSDEITLSFDGLTTGEKEDNPIATDYGALFRLKQRMERNYAFSWARTSIGEAQGVAGWSSGPNNQGMSDGLVLRHGTHSLLVQVNWNPRDKQSRETRDAFLASLRCDSSNATTVSTPAPAQENKESPGTAWFYMFGG
jgi:hypothetical protein